MKIKGSPEKMRRSQLAHELVSKPKKTKKKSAEEEQLCEDGDTVLASVIMLLGFTNSIRTTREPGAKTKERRLYMERKKEREDREREKRKLRKKGSARANQGQARAMRNGCDCHEFFVFSSKSKVPTS